MVSLKIPMRLNQGRLTSRACELDTTKFQAKQIAEIKNQRQGRLMDDKPMIRKTDRRKFLKQASPSVEAISCMPSIDLPVQRIWAAASRPLEMLVLRQEGEQRRVLRVISSSGLSGYADFPDLDYALGIGWCSEE